jgi:hypothetical protein
MSDPLPRYTFLPWLRQGLAASLRDQDSLGAAPSSLPERAAFPVTVRVNDAVDVAQPVQLYGPGDIVSIDARSIVRTDPRPDVADFEPNFFAAIEFFDEDFPWRYTPAASTPQQRLRPWITLAVLKRGEYVSAGQPGPLPALQLTVPAAAIFPPASETWAWAHVHVNDDLMTPAGNDVGKAVALLQQRLSANPDLGISRLLCPRRLEPNTAYAAVVVPTFESGRRAGLGIKTPVADGLASAWGSGQDVFPYFYHWRFRTGERGDFEFLVRLIQPRILDPRVGIRDMDVQEPGMDVAGIVDPPALGLEGALKSLQTKSTEWKTRDPFQADLTALVNLPETLQQPGPNRDPIVAPPLYGRWHASASLLRGAGNPPWLDTLNLDPRTRVPAGFGTEVIQSEQETLVDEAWNQLGKSGLLTANATLKRAQYSRLVGESVLARHIAPLETDAVLRLTAPVHRVVLGSPTTIRHQMGASALPLAAVDPAFRRLTRPRGRLMRRLSLAGEAGRPRAASYATRLNAGELAAARPYVPASNLARVDAVAESLLPAGWPAWLRRLAPFLHWILLAVFVLLLAANAAAGFLSWSPALWLGLAAATGAGFFWLRARAQTVWSAPSSLRQSALTVASIAEIPPRPDFHPIASEADAPDPGSGGSDSVEASRFRQAATALHRYFEEIPAPAPPPPRFPVAAMQARLLEALAPAKTIPNRIRASIRIPAAIDAVVARRDPLDPILWAPEIRDPMYRPLKEISADLLVPNLDLIPQNTIALMQTNQPFIESYMVGLNHEFGRELLWREYPTDQRGTYFRQFWDVQGLALRDSRLTPEEQRDSLYDIQPIHTWPRGSDLGAHNNRATRPGGFLVLTLRSDLLRKYPNTVISAIEAVWNDTTLKRDLSEHEIQPLFHAEVGADLRFFGFDLTKDEANGSPIRSDDRPGWFFVLKERPGEPRFALDEENGPPQTATTWDEMSWSNTKSKPGETLTLAQPLVQVNVPASKNPDKAAWGANAADMAYITYQSPVLIAVHADEMIADEPPA